MRKIVSPVWQYLTLVCIVCLLSSILQSRAECSTEFTLRLLVWDGYAPADMQTVFARYVKEKYGVELHFTVQYASSPDDFFNQLRTGNVDIITPANNLPKDSRYKLAMNGLTIPIDITHVPNYSNLADELRDQPWCMFENRVYAIPIIQGAYGLAYNIDIVKEEPQSWNVLWDPQYAGKYSVQRDYYDLNVYTSALALGYSKADVFHYDRIKGPELENKLKELATNAGTFWAYFDNPYQNNELAFTTTWRCNFPKLHANRDNWRIAAPKEGTSWWVDTMMFSQSLRRSPMLLRIAEEWVNFTLSNQMQVHGIAMRMGIYPVTKGGLALFRKQMAGNPNQKNLELILRNKIPWQRIATRDRNAFKCLWREARETRANFLADDTLVPSKGRN